MRHATSLVCIIWLLIFFNACSQGYSPLPGKERQENDSKNHVASPTRESYPDDQTQSEDSPGKSEGDTTNSNDAELGGQSEKSALSRAKWPLETKVICIDPGHQSRMERTKVPVAPLASLMMPNFSIGTKGITSGAYEYSITLEVAQKLEQGLKKLGARVILTRNNQDEMVGSEKRAQIGNQANADILISLHCDGIEDPQIYGLSVLYPGDKYIEDQKMLEKSLALSKAILVNTVSAANAKDRGLSQRNTLIVFNYSKIPVTLIEMGFLTNPQEDKLLNSEEYQNKLVKGMINGIQEYFESPEAQD